jgi:hypothetical protein
MTIIVSSGLIDRTGFIRYFLKVHVSKGSQSLSTMATIILHFTRNNCLWTYVDIWPGSISSNFDSIRKGRGCSMSPTRSTILGDMLVSNVGEEVGSIYATPDVSFWNILYKLKWLFDDVFWSLLL